MHCKACDGDLHTWWDDAHPGVMNILCPMCIGKASKAVNDWQPRDYEGYWNDVHWMELGGTPANYGAYLYDV